MGSNLFKKNIFGLTFILGFLSFASLTLASTLDLTSSSLNYKVGDTIYIKAIVKSDSSINAISSKISYSKDFVSLSSISKAGSIISLWAQEPKFSNNTGVASLEGVILSGYSGNYGDVVTLVFKANKEGQAEVKFSDVSILANDGSGTDVFSGSLSSVYLKIDKAVEIPKSKTSVDVPVVEKPKTIEKIEDVKEKIVEVTETAVEKVGEVEITNSLPKYSLLITIIVLLSITLASFIIFTFFFFVKLRKYFKNKIIKTEIIIDKNFKNLEEDINLKIEHNSKENGKISKEEVDISDEVVSIKNEIIKEVDAVEKEL